MNRVKKGTSQFKPLPDKEAQICQRLSESRQRSLLTQQELAAKLHTTRDQLANVESKRVPLKFGLGWSACNVLGLNQLWLLNGGEGNGGGVFDLDLSEFKGKYSDEALFSEVCNGVLLEDLSWRQKLKDHYYGTEISIQLAEKTFSKILKEITQDIALRIPPIKRDRFLKELIEFTIKFLESLPSDGTESEPSLIDRDSPPKMISWEQRLQNTLSNIGRGENKK